MTRKRRATSQPGHGECFSVVQPGVCEGRIVMSNQDAYERILASLYDAMLDDTHWPATSALIDEACGLTGNALLVAEGPPRRHPGSLRRALLPGAAPPRSGAGVPRRLPSHQRSHPAATATARRPAGADPRPVHGRGAEDLANLQRGITPVQVSAWLERALGRTWGLPHDLVSR